MRQCLDSRTRKKPKERMIAFFYNDFSGDYFFWQRVAANCDAHERFILNLLKPIMPVMRKLWRWNRPMLVRRLPMWSCRRWRSVT